MNKRTLSERDICTKFITPALKKAGWDMQLQILEEVSFTDGKIYVRGKITARGTRKRADYILYYKPNIPIAIIEAKDNNHSVRAGIQQGLDYARILDIPCVFSSNGDGFLFHDRTATDENIETEISLDDFPTPEQLWEKYKKYKGTTLPRFVELLRSFLLDITESANEYLANEFKEDFSINFRVDKIKCDFNKSVSQKAKDGKFYPPKIPLVLKYNHSSLSEANKIIANPHTFLNEARLTAIALAIRLAMLDLRPKFPDTSSILVLDDLLLSLDMSHRNIVLDIILNKTSDFQLFILTHDKLFFEMARHKIKGLGQTDWEYFEMYSNSKNDIPQPYITKSKTYLEKAETFLTLKEYEVAGNFLRKDAEAFCKDFLPQRLQLRPDYTQHDLNGLIQA